MKRRFSVLIGIARMVLALVFIFSGFVKGVDPWGTALKLNEYFQAFGLDFLSGTRYVLSVLLSTVEMWLGFCLLFRLGGRILNRVVFGIIFFFTLLTLVLAVWNPVADCGCFGDAIQLTNWQTFYKNLVLLLLAVGLLRADRLPKDLWSLSDLPRAAEENRLLKFALGFCFFLFSLGIGLYSLRHLPIIDFLPYRVGVRLVPDHSLLSSAAPEAVLLYRNRQSGEVQEFSLQDTVWQDSLRWEFVDTRFVEPSEPSQKLSDHQDTPPDFAVFDGQGNVSDEWLASETPWFLITLSDLSPMNGKCQERYADLIAYARSQSLPVYGVTSVSLPEDRTLWIGDQQVPLYNMDGTMLKSLIRAHRGALLFQNGTLLAKWNCRDIPDFSERYAGRSILSYLAEAPVRISLQWILGVMGILLVLSYVLYNIYRISRRNRHSPF